MKKKVRITILILALTMIFSTSAFAQDGSDSCTFTTNLNTTGVGYLTVNSTRITARTTLPSGTGYAAAYLEYYYKTSSGTVVNNDKQRSAIQTVETSHTLPSGTSSRKGYSEHFHDDPPDCDIGKCSLWQ